MKTILLSYVIKALLSILSPKLIHEFIDRILDFVEDKVQGSKSTVDDRLVLPLCDMLREITDTPDND
jgi:hypothetical protein